MHFSKTAKFSFMGEVRLLSFATNNVPENRPQKLNEIKQENLKPEKTMTDYLKDAGGKEHEALKAMILDSLKNDGEIDQKEIFDLQNRAMTAIETLQDVNNMPHEKVLALRKSLPTSHKDILDFSVANGWLKPADLVEAAQAGSKNKANKKGEVAMNSDSQAPGYERARPRLANRPTVGPNVYRSLPPIRIIDSETKKLLAMYFPSNGGVASGKLPHENVMAIIEQAQPQPGQILEIPGSEYTQWHMNEIRLEEPAPLTRALAWKIRHRGGGGGNTQRQASDWQATRDAVGTSPHMRTPTQNDIQLAGDLRRMAATRGIDMRATGTNFFVDGPAPLTGFRGNGRAAEYNNYRDESQARNGYDAAEEADVNNRVLMDLKEDFNEMFAEYKSYEKVMGDNPNYKQWVKWLTKYQKTGYTRGKLEREFLQDFNTQLESCRKTGQNRKIIDANVERNKGKEGVYFRLDNFGPVQDLKFIIKPINADGTYDAEAVYQPNYNEKVDEKLGISQIKEYGISFEPDHFPTTGYRRDQVGKKYIKGMNLKFDRAGKYEVTVSSQQPGKSLSKKHIIEVDAKGNAKDTTGEASKKPSIQKEQQPQPQKPTKQRNRLRFNPPQTPRSDLA